MALVNVDGAIIGNHTLWAQASPMLRGTIINATKHLHHAEDNTQTLYDQWKQRMPSDTDPHKPRYTAVASWHSGPCCDYCDVLPLLVTDVILLLFVLL